MTWLRDPGQEVNLRAYCLLAEHESGPRPGFVAVTKTFLTTDAASQNSIGFEPIFLEAGGRLNLDEDTATVESVGEKPACGDDSQ